MTRRHRSRSTTSLVAVAFALGTVLLAACGGLVPGSPPSATEQTPAATQTGETSATTARQAADAAVSVADLAEHATRLFGPGFTIVVGDAPTSIQDRGVRGSWLTAVVERGADELADHQREWRATLAIGYIRDAAATRDFPVPVGSTIANPDDVDGSHEEGPDIAAGTLDVLSLDTPASDTPPLESWVLGPYETDEALIEERLRAAATGASLDMTDVTFIRSIYPIPLIRLAVRGDAEQAVRGFRRSGLLPRLDAPLEGIWYELRDDAGAVILRSGQSRRTGRGSVWVDPKYDAAYRDG